MDMNISGGISSDAAEIAPGKWQDIKRISLVIIGVKDVSLDGIPTPILESAVLVSTF